MVIVYFSGGNQRKKHLYEGEMYSKSELQQKLVEDFPDANLKFAKNKQTDYLVYPDNSDGPSESSEKVASLAKPIFFSAFLRLLFENKIKTITKSKSKSKSKLEPEKRKSTKAKTTIPKKTVSKLTFKKYEYPNLKDFSSILRGVKRFQVTTSYKFFPSEVKKKAIKELKTRFPEHDFSFELEGIEKALDDGYEEIDSMAMECFDDYVKILFNERPKYKPINTRKVPSIKTLGKGVLYLPEINSYESMMMNAKYVNVDSYIVPFEETRKKALQELKKVFPIHQFSAVEQNEIEKALKEGYREWNAMWLDKLYDYVYKGLYNKSMGKVFNYKTSWNSRKNSIRVTAMNPKKKQV